MRRKIGSLDLKTKKIVFGILGIDGKIKTRTCNLTIDQWTRVHESFDCPKSIKSFIRKQIALTPASLEELKKSFQYIREDYFVRPSTDTISLNGLLNAKIIEKLEKPGEILERVICNPGLAEKAYNILNTLENKNLDDWYIAYSSYFDYPDRGFEKIKTLVQNKLSQLVNNDINLYSIAKISVFDSKVLSLLKQYKKPFQEWFRACQSFDKTRTDFSKDYYLLCYDGLLSEIKTPKECITACEVIPQEMTGLLTDKMISLEGTMRENVKYYTLRPNQKLFDIIKEHNSTVKELAILAFSGVPALISLAFEKIKEIKASARELIVAHIEIYREYESHYGEIIGPNRYNIRIRDYFLILILELLRNNGDKGDFKLWHYAFENTQFHNHSLEELAMENILSLVKNVPQCLKCLLEDRFIPRSYYKTELRKILSTLDAKFEVWSNINIYEIKENQELRDIIIEKTVKSAKTWKQKMKLRLNYTYEKFFSILDKDLV